MGYKKHNNNKGWVSEDDRNTPAAFSHFTYEASNKYLLVCDIQGVGDLYTDPQVHSDDGNGFGKGNLGRNGIDEFLSTHRCNPICRYLKLNNVTGLPYQIEGTMPASTHMQLGQVDEVNYFKPGTTKIPLLYSEHQQFGFPA